MDKISREKCEQAYEIVSKVARNTGLVESEYFSQLTGNKVFLKPENMQLTGAYKIRGAYYKISQLSDEDREKGLITASAGNHAQGVAYAAKCYGVKATIVMPTSTPLIKVNRTKALGAEVVLHGNVYDEAYEHACKLAEENGYTMVHPFDDLDVATGQGTIAMEIIKELPTVDYILVPIGGGGLATGVVSMTAAMLLWNYFITPLYMGAPREAVAAMLLPVFLPFNAIKATINMAIALIIYKPISKLFHSLGISKKAEKNAAGASDNSTEGKEKAAHKFTPVAIIVGFVLLLVCIAAILLFKLNA